MAVTVLDSARKAGSQFKMLLTECRFGYTNTFQTEMLFVSLVSADISHFYIDSYWESEKQQQLCV